jgi:TRAP-type C4-dicarboxylate transport system permease small subunit
MGEKLVGKLEFFLELVAGLVLMVMMMITVVDVVGRKIFNLPLPGGLELTELTLVVLIYAGLPLVSRHGEHVVVDLFERWMSPMLKKVLNMLSHLVCSLAFFGIAWLLYRKALSSAASGDYTSVLKVAYAPFIYVMCALVVLTALIHLWFTFFPPPERSEESFEGAL